MFYCDDCAQHYEYPESLYVEMVKAAGGAHYEDKS